MINKALLFAIAPLLCFVSCKKIKNDLPSANQIVLSTPKVSGNLVTLDWSKLTNTALMNYYVVRVTDTASLVMPLYITVDKNTTQFVDTLPLSPYVQYFIVGQLTNTTTPVTSNKELYARTDISFQAITPMDVLFDRTNQQLYVYSATGQIAVYNLQSKKWTNEVTASTAIGYCDLGTYNGVEELYVPGADGWLYVYNAATLAQTDKISVGNAFLGVVNNNGILYLYGVNIANGVASYSRATKTFISQAPSNVVNRMRLIPGSNAQFLCTTNTDETALFTFDGTGKYISDQYGYLSGYNPSPAIFELFQNGSDFISSAYGVIYNASLGYVGALPSGGLSYTSFDFDAAGQLIYAGCTSNVIQSYSISNYQAVNTVSTQGYPFKVFYNNGSLLSVSTNMAPQASGPTIYTFVEQPQ